MLGEMLLLAFGSGEMQDETCDALLGEMLVPASSGGEMLWLAMACLRAHAMNQSVLAGQ